ncbi:MULTISPECIES: glycosyltransferase [unclassified Sphingomonas]|uniref:glycosyltransferase n=1 Tax=unclassified Sphingomonas TaxID=196159 RepID=UPI0006F314C0|nr:MULTISPECIES: glycosyltransferase [unclassified Sphingomonas]KQX22749.1 group 1 glycosyl transferase [Sphingomonas sp. Root1294]KQY67773.1 group 1 glycosyl transferase [Sphingomonas sp. Root50]KRB88695.1 group 1 glycosyl transferase [Sphingomonas sp. Root720]
MGKRILFVHQNFPGQFLHIADALVARGDQVAAIGASTARLRSGVSVVRWESKISSTKDIFPPASRAEADLIRAQAAATAAVGLGKNGFVPDLIIGHPGWGETLHLKEIFPNAKLILFGEYYYSNRGGDVNFDLEFEKPSLQRMMRTNGKNATQALAYVMADRIVSPTPFQASTLPSIFQPRIKILHEGIDLSRARHNPAASFTLPDGRVLDRSTPVITFINRNFERLRGFHIFMRALPAFLDAVPEAHVIAMGADGTGYGGDREDGQWWRKAMLAELGDRLDRSRVHFVGQVEYERMIDILSIGAAHVYYTYPFTLSWSLVDAMATECLILGSDTAPVRDAIVDGQNGVLNDFFDVEALTGAMIDAVRRPDHYAPMRKRARVTAMSKFDRDTIGVPRWLNLIDQTLAERSGAKAKAARPVSTRR